MHSASGNGEEKSCNVCTKTLKSTQSLRDHVYYYHSPKTCEMCDKEFPGAYLYYYHRNKVNGILLPKLFCLTVRKNCSRDREKLLKFKTEGREFSKFQNIFYLVPGGFS